MFDIPRLYLPPCSSSVQLVPLLPINMSILFHDYRELKECISEVEQLEAKVNNGKKKKGIIKRGRKTTRGILAAAATKVKIILILKSLLQIKQKIRKGSH